MKVMQISKFIMVAQAREAVSVEYCIIYTSIV